MTVEVGSSSVNVGSLTSLALYTSVSNALQTLCGGDDSTTACAMGASATQTIEHVAFINENNDPEDGDLLVSVLDSNFSSNDIKNMMVASIATVVNASATGGNCWNVTNENENAIDYDPDPITYYMCNAAGFVGFQYYSEQSGFEYIDAYLTFQVPQSKGEFACDEFIGFAEMALQIFLPEMKIPEEASGAVLKLGCQAAVAEESSDATSTSNGLVGEMSSFNPANPLSVILSPFTAGAGSATGGS
ncbi:MAG: hypothetical protein M1822_005203 [Bathelium mastoideum]|nr:MAG: hypothetical protein M1822_005203 [Bathelium mastoideum]